MINLAEVVKRAKELIENKRKRKNLRFDIEFEDCVMYTDVDKLVGLLFTFLDNSVKYTNYGAIMLKAGEGHQAEYIKFEIIDSGIGIDEENLQKITSIIENPFLDVKTSAAAGIGIGFRVA